MATTHFSILQVPGESHGQRSLVDYSPRGRKESDMTEQLNSNSNDYTSSILHKIYFCQWVIIESLENTDFDVSVDIV